MNKSNKVFEDFLNMKLLTLDGYSISVHQIVLIFILFIMTKLVLSFIRRGITRANKTKLLQDESIYTLKQITGYIIWLVSLFIALNILGIKITALWTGSAALMVGVGIGLKQTFNDFISGIILLFEGKTKVGDLLEVEDRLMILDNIGLRTSTGTDRDGISIIIPNSKIVTDKVINWTHQKKKPVRFRINIGVAYGSDVERVIKLLEECARGHKDVSKKENIEARFVDFGTSSLDFQLMFYSANVFRNGRVTSDIRRNINRTLNENNIVIAYPQLDVHLRKDD